MPLFLNQGPFGAPALRQAAEETPPFTLYVQKRGLQNGKDSYHDTLGHTYIRKIDRRREHLGPSLICYVRRMKTSNHEKPFVAEEFYNVTACML